MALSIDSLSHVAPNELVAADGQRDLMLVARVCLFAGGLVMFGASLIGLMSISNERQLGMYLEFAVPLVLWLSGWLPRFRMQQAAIQISAGLLFFFLPFVAPDTLSLGWIPLTILPWAIIFSAVFSMPNSSGVIAILLVVFLDVAAHVNPPAQFDTGGEDPADVPLLAHIPFITVVAFSLLVLVRRWWSAVLANDRAFERMQRAAISSIRESSIRISRTAVERRIHETVLNTLNAIAHGIGRIEPNLIKVECERDLLQLESWAEVDEVRTVESVIRQAVEASGISLGRITINCAAVETIQGQTYEAVRDVLVEALRNVERHSQATAVRVNARVRYGFLEVSIIDNGIGIKEVAQPRFGLRNTILGTVEALNGNAVIEAGPNGGTKVHFTVPLQETLVADVMPEQSIELIFQTWFSRILIMSPAIAGSFGLYFVHKNFDDPVLMAVLYCSFLAANIWLAFRWDLRESIAIAYLAIGIFAATYIALLVEEQGCNTVATLNWVVTSMGGGICLVVFAMRGRRDIWVPIVVVFGGGSAVFWHSKGFCATGSVTNIVDTLIYVTAASYAVLFMVSRVEKQQQDALSTWAEKVQSQALVEQEDARVASWELVSLGTKQFFTEIVSDQIDLGASSTAMRAEMEEGRLRRELGLGNDASTGFWRAASQAARAAGMLGKRVDALRMSETGSSIDLPRTLSEFLGQVCMIAENGSVKIRIFEDAGNEELLITAPSNAVLASASEFGLTQQHNFVINGIVVEFYEGEPAQVSLRRA